MDEFWEKNKKLKARLISAIRREFQYCDQRKQALKKSDKGLGFHQCEKCLKSYPKKEVNIDHKDPVVPITGFTDFNTYIDRLFKGELQTLCLKCHKAKTGVENSARRQKPNVSIFELFKDQKELVRYKNRSRKKKKS